MSTTRSIQIQGVTDVGRVRDGNEDCFIIQPMGSANESLNPSQHFEVKSGEDVFMAVSDGMGGAAAGEVASQTGLQTMNEYILGIADDLKQSEPEAIAIALEESARLANEAIRKKALAVRSRRGMGATVTAAYLKNDILYLLQVGDSRAYVLRENKLIRVTRDQSFVGHLVEMGTITEAQAMRHPQRSVILQALGTQDSLKADVSFLPLCRGDQVIICSDGLYSDILPEQLEEEVLKSKDGSIDSLVNFLVDTANDAGGKDNITVIVMNVNDAAPAREPGENPAYQPFPFLNRDHPLEKAQSLFH